MQTVVIDIINEKAMKLLRELELLKLIRVHKEKVEENTPVNWKKYKGAMSRQPLPEVDDQLDKLREDWE